MPDVPPISIQIKRIKSHHIRRRMLAQAEAITFSSESESESMDVPGQETPPSVGSKEEKTEVLLRGKGKSSDVKSPEPEKEKPKPRASVLEYKSVSQMYVLGSTAMHLFRKVGRLRVLKLGQRYLWSQTCRLSGRLFQED